MRTTIRLDDQLLREAKARAARAGRSLNEFIADAVRLALRPERRREPVPPIPVLQGGRGLRAGVSLDHSASLLDIMDEGARHR
jgi:plasmid stability protein